MGNPAITWRVLAIISLAGLVVAGSPLLTRVDAGPVDLPEITVTWSLLPAPIGIPLADRGPRGPRSGWLDADLRRPGIAGQDRDGAEADRSATRLHSGQVVQPSTIGIPAIDVHAPIDPLGLNPDGSIEVPGDSARTGWWEGGPEPGEVGAAVVLGHVDSYTGPGVFYALGRLERGDAVTIDLVDGTRLRYVVTGRSHHAKEDFPTETIYRPDTGDSLLRLITCGGDFDWDDRSYTDVLVVYATLVSSQRDVRA